MAINISIESNIKSKEIIGDVSKAVKSVAVANAAKNIMDAYVPFDEGIMAGSAYAEEGAVVYPVMYAVYPYNKSFNFKTDRHPKATNKWDKASIGENCNGPEGGKFLKEAAAIIKEGMS